MKLYSLAKTGELLGGLKTEGVRMLIHAGKLKAVTQPLRPSTGKCPRMYVTEAEIDRYIRDLEANAPRHKEPKPRKRRAWLPEDLQKELDSCWQYV